MRWCYYSVPYVFSTLVRAQTGKKLDELPLLRDAPASQLLTTVAVAPSSLGFGSDRHATLVVGAHIVRPAVGSRASLF